MPRRSAVRKAFSTRVVPAIRAPDPEPPSVSDETSVKRRAYPSVIAFATLLAIVSASRAEQRGFDAPAAVQSIGRDAIRASGPGLQLSEPLSRLPGVIALDRQNFAWVIPYHEGAVKALKEAGVWKPEHEAHNQKLLQRQGALADAWQAFLKSNPSDDKAAFAKAWMEARSAALNKIGQDPVF